MSNSAPICHIPPKNTSGNPQPKNLPGLPGPVSPPQTGNAAQDAFNAAMAALLNYILALLREMANQNPGQTNNAVPKQTKGTWTETNRVTSKVRVFQNNDPTSPNWVDVEQINQLTMGNKKTGDQWTWNRNR